MGRDHCCPDIFIAQEGPPRLGLAEESHAYGASLQQNPSAAPESPVIPTVKATASGRVHQRGSLAGG